MGYRLILEKLNVEKLSVATRDAIAKTLVAIQFFMLAAIAIVGITKVHAKAHTYLGMEIGLVALGLLIIASAGFALRPSLRISPIPKDNSPLIENGIYRRVRHPMYLGVILIGCGMAGYADSWISWILELVLIIDLNIKARFEDALLREIHPESMHYQMHVSRILPCMSGSCRTNCISQ